MKERSRLVQQIILLAGDILVLALVTLFGFASHGELASSGVRYLATFIPLVVAWLLVAPFLGVFDPQRAADPRQLMAPILGHGIGRPDGGLAARRLIE